LHNDNEFDAAMCLCSDIVHTYRPVVASQEANASHAHLLLAVALWYHASCSLHRKCYEQAESLSREALHLIDELVVFELQASSDSVALAISNKSLTDDSLQASLDNTSIGDGSGERGASASGLAVTMPSKRATRKHSSSKRKRNRGTLQVLQTSSSSSSKQPHDSAQYSTSDHSSDLYTPKQLRASNGSTTPTSTTTTPIAALHTLHCKLHNLRRRLLRVLWRVRAACEQQLATILHATNICDQAILWYHRALQSYARINSTQVATAHVNIRYVMHHTTPTPERSVVDADLSPFNRYRSTILLNPIKAGVQHLASSEQQAQAERTATDACTYADLFTCVQRHAKKVRR
jgi:hypothetical protein